MPFGSEESRKAFFAKLKKGTRKTGEVVYRGGQKAAVAAKREAGELKKLPEQRRTFAVATLPLQRRIDLEGIKIKKAKNNIDLYYSKIKQAKQEGRAGITQEVNSLNSAILEEREAISEAQHNVEELKLEIQGKRKEGITSRLGRVL